MEISATSSVRLKVPGVGSFLSFDFCTLSFLNSVCVIRQISQMEIDINWIVLDCGIIPSQISTWISLPYPEQDPWLWLAGRREFPSVNSFPANHDKLYGTLVNVYAFPWESKQRLDKPAWRQNPALPLNHCDSENQFRHRSCPGNKNCDFSHLWGDCCKPHGGGRTHPEPLHKWRGGFIFLCVLMSLLGLGRIRLISLSEQFGPSWREPQVTSLARLPQSVRGGCPSATRARHQHPSPVVRIVWLSVSLTQLSPWEQALSSTLLHRSDKLYWKLFAFRARVLWWPRTSAFEKVTVLQKQNWGPPRRRDLQSK